MRTYTQISFGREQPEIYAALEEKLTPLDICVASPAQSGDVSLWQTYSRELYAYKAIAKSSFHILYNNDPLTHPALLQVLYAMHKHRPIITIGRPSYGELIEPELRDILEARIRRLQSANLLKLEFAEVSFLINKLKPEVDYKLNETEEAIILAKIREHLYHLVGQGLNEINKVFHT